MSNQATGTKKSKTHRGVMAAVVRGLAGESVTFKILSWSSDMACLKVVDSGETLVTESEVPVTGQAYVPATPEVGKRSSVRGFVGVASTSEPDDMSIISSDKS